MNRRHGWVDYHERLARVAAYLHDHLADDLDLARIAEIAHLSPYHWHRVWHAMHGETLASTVRRMRLHRAAGYLANTGLAVDSVAFKCGYPNARAFAHAFQAMYGMSPSRYRKEGGHAVFHAGANSPLEAGYSLEVRFVPEVMLAGIDHRGSYMMIAKAFETAYSRLAAQNLIQAEARWMAVYLDDPFAVPEAQLQSRAGLSVAGVAPPPLVPFTLGGQRCAVLRHRGPYATMRSAYQWLYGDWLVRSGEEPGDQPVFEEYLNNPRHAAPKDLVTDIFVPLRD